MAERLHPGIYTEEKSSGPAPISGVATSTAAFVGFTLKGVQDTPTIVTNVPQFVREFGGFTASAIMPTSVYAFFKNGGRRAMIVRTLNDDAVKAAVDVYQYPEVQEATDGSPAPTVAPAFDAVVKAFTITIANEPVAGSVSVAVKDITSPFAYVTEMFFDDGSGNMVRQIVGVAAASGVNAGTIDYAGKTITITTNTAPSSDEEVVVTYLNKDSTATKIFQFNLEWAGVAGNDMRVVISGDPEYETPNTATFTRFRIEVQEQDASGDYNILEAFDGVDLTGTTDANFIDTVIDDTNSGSNVFSYTVLGTEAIPNALVGTRKFSYDAGTLTVTSTDETGDAYSYTQVDDNGVVWNVADTTFKMQIDTGVNLTVLVDDGDGNVTVDTDASGPAYHALDAAGTNTIDYDTCEVFVTFDGDPGSVALSTDGDFKFEFYTKHPSASISVDAASGTDGTALTSTEVTGAAREATEQGVYALNKVDDMLSVCVPDFETDTTVGLALVDYCESRKDRFAILSVPEGLTPQAAKDWMKRTLNRNSSYYAVYYPHIKIIDPVTNKAANHPGGGHVAGIFARTDIEKNVGKAPAGMADGALRFAIGLERSLSTGDVDLTFPVRINNFVDWVHTGRVLWGARTGESNGDFGYIQARRLFMFVEKSVFNATHIHVFENNGPKLWGLIRMQLNSFLINLYNEGYFKGSAPQDAFFVIVDSSNNPETSIAAGILYVDVGIAVNKPAEFLVFRFQQIVGTAD